MLTITTQKKIRTIGFLPLAALLASTAISGASAQTLPPSADPAKIQKRFEDQPTPTAAPRVVAPIVTEPGLSKEATKKLASHKFTLKEVVIEGNTAFSAEALKSCFAGELGKQTTALEARGIAKCITDKYRSNEYILSQAVVQDIKGGTLKIRVVEGYISNVRTEGDVRDSNNKQLLESYAANIKGKRPIKLSDLERYMLLMDDLPGATAKAVVRPSATAGSADLVVTFVHKPYEASYNINNRGSRVVGPLQHSVTLAANSLFNMYDRTLVRVITASPTTELRFIDVQHEEQISDEGTRLLLTGSYSHSEPGDVVSAADFRTDSWFMQAKATHPFLRSRQENLTGRFVFDSRNSDTDIFAVTPLTRDRLRSVRLGGAYDFGDDLGGVNLFDLELSQGLNIFNASETGTDRSRADGESDYTKLNFDITRTQSLSNNFSLYASGTSQYSFSRLLSAEQFTVGGAGFGQAYNPAEISGDHGVAAKLELRYGRGVDFGYLTSYQAYGFYDIGKAWVRDGGLGANDKRSLASTGLGVRTNFAQFVSADMQVALPLTKAPNEHVGDRHDPRFFFSVTGRF